MKHTSVRMSALFVATAFVSCREFARTAVENSWFVQRERYLPKKTSKACYDYSMRIALCRLQWMKIVFLLLFALFSSNGKADNALVELKTLQQFQTDFNAGLGKVRIVALLSPT